MSIKQDPMELLEAFEKRARATRDFYVLPVVVAKRAAQIVAQEKEDLKQELAELNMDEGYYTPLTNNNDSRENLSKVYEKREKPVFTAIKELLKGDLEISYPKE